MELLNHDLAHEFPQYLEKMRGLKMSDPHFSSLFIIRRRQPRYYQIRIRRGCDQR